MKGCPPANLPLRFIPPKSISPAVQKQVSFRLSICLRAPPVHVATGGHGFAGTTPPIRQSLPSHLGLLPLPLLDCYHPCITVIYPCIIVIIAIKRPFSLGRNVKTVISSMETGLSHGRNGKISILSMKTGQPYCQALSLWRGTGKIQHLCPRSTSIRSTWNSRD